MKCRFIQAESAHPTIRILCRVLGVPRSTYYSYRRKPPTDSDTLNAELLREIRRIHAASNQRYGQRRIWRELAKHRPGLGRRRVARLMRDNGLQAKHRRRFRVTTDSRHSHPVEPNVLAREFTADAPNRRWVGDITYVWTRAGWLYLAVIIDLFSRRVIGWAMSECIDKELVLKALQMAVGQRQPAAGLLHHTDRGSQYTSGAYRKALSGYRAIVSMSRKGDCWDNAVSESFFATLKKEAIFGENFNTREQAELAILRYLRWYNAERLHSKLGYLSPCEFENEAAELTSRQVA
ncbi:MAG: IS3 family transposase [bacterium]